MFNSFLYISNYYEIKDDVINFADIDDEDDEYDDNNKVRFLIFEYIKERYYNNALFAIKSMKKLIEKYKWRKDEVDNNLRKINMYKFLNIRKLIIQ